MFKKSLAAGLVGLSILATAGSAFAALDNENKGVAMVDVNTSTLFIHLTSDATGTPSCVTNPDFKNIIICSLADEFCERAMSIALAAQLSGKNIDFDFSGTCGASGNNIAKFNRLRINP